MKRLQIDLQKHVKYQLTNRRLGKKETFLNKGLEESDFKMYGSYLNVK